MKLQSHRTDWWVRHARRLLQERAAAGTLEPTTVPALRIMLDANTTVPGQLRAVWALHAIGGTDELALLKRLDLARHPGDANDPNLGLMLWYRIEPSVASDSAEAARFLSNWPIRQVRHSIARRLAEE